MRTLASLVMACLSLVVFASLAVADAPLTADAGGAAMPPGLQANLEVRVVVLVSKGTVSVVSPEKYDEVFENDLPEGMTLLICDALTMQATGGEHRPVAVVAKGDVALRSASFAARCEEVSIHNQRIAMSGNQVELLKTEIDGEQPSLTLRASRVVIDPTSALIEVDGSTTIDGLLPKAALPR